MSFFRDLRIAVRSLARVRSLWLTVAFTLALGIGANAAIFSVVRAVLLRPLANRDEDRLLYIRQSATGIGVTNATFSIPEIHDLADSHLKTITELGTFSTIDFTVIGLGTPREIPAGVVDGNYFQVMGLKPVLGRLLGPSDDGQNAPGAVVLTYGFWKTSLHSDPSVLGKQVRLDSGMGSRGATVIGVLEPSVPYPVATEIIANVVTSPHHLSATMVQGREHRMTEVFGRLAPGAKVDAARAELRTAYNAMIGSHPEVYKAEDHYAVDVTRMHDQINARANTVLWILFAASALLFIIASSNVANLVLARTVRREPELAVRSALGASTGALRRSLLAESLVLCTSGAIAAVLIAVPMVEVLGRYAQRYSVRARDLTLDFSLVWFGIALALIAAIFLAYIPRLPSPDSPQGGLTGRGTRVAGAGSRRLRVFAVVQIMISFLLLGGACILMKTLYVLEQTRPPYDSAQVLAINLPVMSYKKTPEQINDFYRRVKERISTLPGIDMVSEGFSSPWRDDRLNLSFEFSAQGAKPRADGTTNYRSQFRSVSPGFFATMGVPILNGRDFNDGDKEGAERVVIISQSLADELYPGGNAVNRTMRWTDGVMKYIGISYEPRRIIAVVPDFDDENIIPAPAKTIYQPTTQEGWNGRLFIRAKGDPYALVPAIDRTVHEMSADQPVEKASTLGDVRGEVLTPAKLDAIVFGGFAAVALLISVVGVAGVLAFSVSSRTREFGIRIAMGALPRDILTNVLTEGAVMASMGVAVGVVLGFIAVFTVRRFVGEIHYLGPLAFIASALVIMMAAIIASAVPAARAARVNAVEALRTE
jgi:putative ABC transport system permease protein